MFALEYTKNTFLCESSLAALAFAKRFYLYLCVVVVGIISSRARAQSILNVCVCTHVLLYECMVVDVFFSSPNLIMFS